MTNATLKAFEDCLHADAAHRSSKEIEDCVALREYYEQHAQERVKRVNDVLGVGLLDVANHRPLEVGLLRYAIDRQAVVYSRPATRWLRSAENKRLEGEDPQTALMRKVYAEANVDLVMRRVDRLANLLQVVALRVYALGQRLEVRLFTPDLMRRNPDNSVQTDLARDQSFALKVGADTWEFWQRLHALGVSKAEERWTMAVVQWTGKVRSAWWPFGQGTRLLTPPILLESVPALLIYEQLTDEAWPSPRTSRLAATETINAMANDLWAGQRHDTHNTRVWKGVSAEDLPAQRGPGREIAVNQPPGSVEVEDLSPQTQLGPSSQIQQQTTSYFLVSEDLPPDDTSTNGKQVVTGAAHKVRLFGLVERRAAQAMIAPTNEQRLWAAARDQYNRMLLVRGGLQLLAGDQSPEPMLLDPTTRIEVELAPMELPQEPANYIAAAEARLRLGVTSRLEIRMELTGANREQALDALLQVEKDEKLLGPLPEAPTPAGQPSGPAAVSAAPPKTEEEKKEEQ